MREYKITHKYGEMYNAEVTDSYGNKYQNWFDSNKKANDWIYYVWSIEKPQLTQEEKDEMLANAIWGCTKLDEELELLSGNRDNLD